MIQSNYDSYLRLAIHITNTIHGVQITGPTAGAETNVFEIYANRKNKFGFEYKIKMAEFTMSRNGPIFRLFINDSKLATRIMEAIDSFNPNP